MQILLLAMNATVLDVTDDELQLLAVEELLPLSGPSSVSVFGKSKETSPPSTAEVSSPSGSRRLLAGQNLERPLHYKFMCLAGNNIGEGNFDEKAWKLRSKPQLLQVRKPIRSRH